MSRPPLPAVLLAGAFPAVLACLWLLIPAREVPPTALVLAGAGCVLELAGVAVAGFGFVSVAPAMFLASTALAGPRPASLGATAAWLLRGLSRGRSGRWGRVSETCADAVPTLGACLALSLGVWLPLACALWLGLALAVPGILAATLEEREGRDWARARARLLSLLVAVAVAAPGLALSQGPALLSLALVLLALQGAAPGLAAAVSRGDLEPLQARVNEYSHQVEQLRYELEGVRLVALRKSQELKDLERLARSLSRADAVTGAVDLILEMTLRSAPTCQSAVLFVPEGEGLACAGARTPRSERLKDAGLLQLGEPAVEQARRTGRAVCLRDQPSEGRLLGDSHSLAVPLGDEGVLYVGSREPEGLDEATQELLAVVGAQATVALQSGRRRQAEVRALEQHRSAHERLKRWVDRLATLLDGTRSLVATLDPGETAERLQTMLTRLIPARFGAVLGGPEGAALQPLRLWGGKLDPAATRALADSVRHRRRPLLFEAAESSRFAPLVEGQQSLLAVPLQTEQECFGVLVLGHFEPGAFAREDQDLLHLVGFLAGVAWSNAALHQELKDAQAQLVQSSKMAAVGQLAAGVAHELNTPLAAIQMSTESAQIKLQDRPDLALKRLEKVRTAVAQAQKIVSNLLLYCRGQEAPLQDPVDLNEVVESALALIGHQLREDSVDLQLVQGTLPPVTGNASQLQQVVTNLLLNARDAVRLPGARSQRILVSTCSAPGQVLLTVQDDGPGIPSEAAPHLFEPFFTTKPVGKGTGLGLSVSHQIVQRHGGSLRAESPPGTGARFVLQLPAETVCTDARG